MRAYRIVKNAGPLILFISFVLSASAYGQTSVVAGKDCPEAASNCGSSGGTDPASVTPLNHRQTSSLQEGHIEQNLNHLMDETTRSSNDTEPCTPTAQIICPPPSASVNKLDDDLPSPASLKETRRDVYSRPSTANNSYKSDQTKDERGRTVMGH